MLPTDVDLVNLSAAIYDNTSKWDHFDKGDGDEICWALKKLDGCDVIVFRGSITAHDWIEDFTFFPVQSRIGTVHFGFYSGMERVHAEVSPMLTQQVMVTGHSLGSARADILCALMIVGNKPPIRRAVFGSPRVGMHDFARIVRGIPGDGYRNADAEGHDLVTDVPLHIRNSDLDFIHTKPLVDLPATRTGNVFERNSIFALHHIQIYQASVKAHFAKELVV